MFDVVGPQFVTYRELRSLLDKDNTLVIDCRSPEAFEDSRISITSNIINPPKLYIGITCSAISKDLTGHAKLLFDQRHKFEKVGFGRSEYAVERPRMYECV